MYDVYCISAGQIDVKKGSNIINKKNLYLNYGLLGLTSIIHEHGLNPIQLHGGFTPPDEFVAHCASLGISNTQHPVFISMPSFYALSWLKEFTKFLKQELGIKKVVLGGRWVIDGEPDLLKAQLPFVDEVIDGLGENEIIKLLNLNLPIIPQFGYPQLNYNLLENRALFQPSLEVSRGCGMKCHFCQEKSEPLKPLKSASIVIKDAKKILLNDDLVKMTPYFEASMFIADKHWLQNLIIEKQTNNMDFQWRAESRVDSLNIKMLPLLAKAGLKVLDLGLESASPVQITNMGKSRAPEKYLNKASQLLKIAYSLNIKVKVNIMLYAGETTNTIDETYKWLELHREYITGVSVGPVVAFGWDKKKVDFISSMEKLGAKVAIDNSLLGVTYMDLSPSISKEKANELSKDISREFMSHKEYFYLKSFSYFPRDYSFSRFEQDIKSGENDYSFKFE